MPPSLGAPTTRITVVLETADVETMKRRYGRGWTHRLRLLVHQDNAAYRKHKRTLEQALSQGQTEEFDEH